MAFQRFTPRTSLRGTAPYGFFELSLARGPVQIAVTGDNSYETLYGRAWLLVWDEADDYLKLYQEVSEGVWDRVTVDLPSVFNAPLFDDASHVVFSFDQSARIIVVYERDSLIYVTRWDAGLSQYIQNVTFAGHDPVLLMDATLADPRGYPSLVENGWGVRDAYNAGIRVLFQWIPNGQWLESAISDSDVLIFYLSLDRTQVWARVQRQVYATELLIHTFTEPVILDRAVPLPGRYELLLSSAVGNVRASMLISESYFADLIIAPEVGDTGRISAAPTLADHRQLMFKVLADEAAALTSTPIAGLYQQTTLVLAALEAQQLGVTALDGLYQQTTWLAPGRVDMALASSPLDGVYNQRLYLHLAEDATSFAAAATAATYRET